MVLFSKIAHLIYVSPVDSVRRRQGNSCHLSNYAWTVSRCSWENWRRLHRHENEENVLMTSALRRIFRNFAYPQNDLFLLLPISANPPPLCTEDVIGSFHLPHLIFTSDIWPFVHYSYAASLAFDEGATSILTAVLAFSPPSFEPSSYSSNPSFAALAFFLTLIHWSATFTCSCPKLPRRCLDSLVCTPGSGSSNADLCIKSMTNVKFWYILYFWNTQKERRLETETREPGRFRFQHKFREIVMRLMYPIA